MNLLSLLVPGVGMGGGEAVVTVEPRVLYRPNQAPAPVPTSPRPALAAPPALYRPQHDV